MAAPVESLDLEALVRDELRGPVSELVRRLIPQLVAEALTNGAGEPGTETPPRRSELPPQAMRALAAIPEPPQASTGATTKTCRICNETKPAGKFDRGRLVCRACRSRQERERQVQRQASDDEEPPRPDGDAG